MFKLLIVDDEPILVEGLCERFREYNPGCLDVYKAYSAQEALEWLNRKRIDVVISDIKMPEMDGLQLLERIKRNWPGCKVVFLTGYDEFTYIYEATRYDGVSYLLKTECHESVIAAVEKHLEEIRESFRNEQLIKKAEEKMKKALPLLQKEFLSDLLDGMEERSISQQLLDDIEIPLRLDAPVILLLGRIVCPDDRECVPGGPGLYSVNSTIEQYISPQASLAGCIYQKDYSAWLLQPAKCDPDMQFASFAEAALFYRNMLESVQYACRDSFNLKVSFAISCDAVPWNGIWSSCAALKSILNGCMRQDMEVIATDSHSREQAAEGGSRRKELTLQLKKLEHLETALELGRRDEFFRVFADLREYFTRIAPREGLDEEAYYAISLLFVSYINRHGMRDIVSAKLNTDKQWGSNIHATMEESFRFFEQVAGVIFDVQRIETDKRSMASILDIQQHIQDNLGGDLSLNSLADLVFFNPKYLSRLFKQETGSNLHDYINDKRLSKAKELLRKSNIRIYEIAEAVGYSSGAYFANFFRKGTNMTPQEYRDLANK